MSDVLAVAKMFCSIVEQREVIVVLFLVVPVRRGHTPWSHDGAEHLERIDVLGVLVVDVICVACLYQIKDVGTVSDVDVFNASFLLDIFDSCCV